MSGLASWGFIAALVPVLLAADWSGAARGAGELTIAPNVAHAEEIRAGVADARATGRGLWGACASGPAPAAAATTTVKPAPAASVLGPATTAAAPAASGGCHPSYRGACVPIASDVDCAGGGGDGDGPAYVSEKDIQVVGFDVYGLDGNDNDGIGCEPRR